MGQVRTTRPGASDKYYIRKSSGGYSTCIQGKPTDKYCDVLANCVGYACGALNEEDAYGYEKYHLNCNAENFIERAIASGLSVYKEPKVGDIMVWKKGKTLSSSDGAGHVAVCIYNDGHTIKYAQSGYGSSKPFWITTTTNSNGRYGLSRSYEYRGSIRPSRFVQDEPEPVPEPTPQPVPQPEPTPTPVTPVPEEIKTGDTVLVNGRGTAASDGTGAKTRNFKDTKMKVILINSKGKNAYALNQYNKGTVGKGSDVTGWFNKNDIKKV